MGLELSLSVDPRIVNSTFGVSLSYAQWLHGFVLAIPFTDLDADMLRFKVIFVIEAEPALLIPNRYALVHTVIPRLETLDRSLGSSAEPSCKFLLDALPLHLLVVPGVYDVVALLCCVLLVNVPTLAVWWWTWIAMRV